MTSLRALFAGWTCYWRAECERSAVGLGLKAVWLVSPSSSFQKLSGGACLEWISVLLCYLFQGAENFGKLIGIKKGNAKSPSKPVRRVGQ